MHSLLIIYHLWAVVLIYIKFATEMHAASINTCCIYGNFTQRIN